MVIINSFMPKRKKLKRNRPQIPLLLSTDIAGIFATKPHLFYQLIQTLDADCCHIDGVEFLPFRFSYRRVQQALKKFNIPIIGIHSPIAWDTPDRNFWETIYAAPFSSVMPSVKTALKLTATTKPNYLLFHEPDLDKCCFTRQLTTYLKQESTPTILLENVYRPNSLQISVDKVKKLQSQTRAGVMIDLVHLLMETLGIFSSFTDYRRALNKQNIDSIWLKMLIAIDKALEQIPVAGLHIPIGTNRDSLPWQLLKTKHWQQLAKLLDKHQDKLIALVLENQHLETALSMNRKHLPAIIKNKKKKIKTLLQAGVL